jgi:hypothetical protein
MITRRGFLGAAAVLATGAEAVVMAALAQGKGGLRALVVGIDRYEFENNLRGAVNDAKDIADALTRTGRGSTRLLDGEATRTAVWGGLKEMLETAEPGDTVLFTYAGHGSHEPDSGPVGSKQEILVFSKFTSHAPGCEERLRGREMVNAFAEASARGVKVIFVADACYSGGLVRPFDTRGIMLPTRAAKQPLYEMIDDPLPPVPPAKIVSASEPRPKLPNLVFLSAALKDEVTPEVRIGDKPRGALSWAFARALEGAAAGPSGELRLGQLSRFIKENVRMQSNARQTPDVMPNDDDDRLVWQFATKQETGQSPEVVGLFIRGAVPEDALPPGSSFKGHSSRRIDSGPLAENALPRLGDRVRVVGSPVEADLIWEVAAGELIDSGDLIAEGVSMTSLPQVLDKVLAVRDLRGLRPDHPMIMRLEPNDGRHHDGSRIAFTIDGRDGSWLVLFSLASDGTIQFHFPRRGEDPQPPLEKPVALRFEVGPPFGCDHLIALAAAQDLSQVAEQLRGMDQKQASRSAAELVQSVVRSRRVQLGLQPLFTTR